MLIEFAVTNFRSIKERQVFSMEADNSVKEHPDNLITVGKDKYLSSAVVYGRNASGKSNLLKAMSTLLYLIKHSANFKIGERIKEYEPYKLNSENLIQQVIFEVEFLIEEVRYRYKVEYESRRIIHESLYYYPKKQPALLFSRQEGNPIQFGNIKGNKKNIEKNLLTNQLFLSKIGENDIEELKQPYLFFTRRIYVGVSFDPSYEERSITALSKYLVENPNGALAKNLNKMLRAVDTNIESFKVKEYDRNEFGFPIDFPEQGKELFLNENRYNLTTTHVSTNKEGLSIRIAFELEEESLGTKNLILYGGMILSVLSKGHVLVIDELDKSLHPLLTRMLIQLFHNPKTNPKNAQLIFASHDATLLDNKLFRRDQIWFTEKEKTGETSFYSLSDIKGVRAGYNFEEGYLTGRFQAIPLIDPLELNFTFEDGKEE